MSKDWHAIPFRNMVALGESTTAGGWSTSRHHCWVSVLGQLINAFQSVPMAVHNMGIGANVISNQSPCYAYSGKPAANDRLDQHVIAKKPDLLLISYGLNDARGGTPLDLFCREFVAILQRVRQEIRPLTLLLGPYYMTDFKLGGRRWSHADLDLFRKFNEAIAKIAEDNTCLFVNVLQANGETNWMVHYDGVHANDLGHRIVANRIFEVLAQHCSCLAASTKEAESKSPRWRDESTLRADYGYE